MNLLPGVQRITTDIAIGTSGKPIRVFQVNLVSGGQASALTLINGSGLGGETYDQIDGITGQSVSKGYTGGLRFPSGCYANSDAYINYATVIFTEEH